MKEGLLERWNEIRMTLLEARTFLPDDVDCKQFGEWLDHNEFRLAWDELDSLADDHEPKLGFRLKMADAYVLMSGDKR